MDDLEGVRQPARLMEILEGTLKLGWVYGSDPRLANLLRGLVASKPRGRFLELGTGTGMATIWILDGMDKDGHLISVDRGEPQQSIARRVLGDDPRVRFILQDSAAFLEGETPGTYDLIFADGGAGKFTQLDTAIKLLRPGGFYVVDDLMSFPADRAEKVTRLRAELTARPDLHAVPMSWASSIMVCVKRG